MLEAIQSLLSELQVKIYKKYLTLKIRERLDHGWRQIHEQILSAPFCDLRNQISYIVLCRECEDCEKIGACFLCYKKGEEHYLGESLVFFHDRLEYDEDFLKFI